MNNVSEYLIKQALVFHRNPLTDEPVVDELRRQQMDARRQSDDRQLLLQNLAAMDKSTNRQQLAAQIAEKAHPTKPWMLGGGLVGGLGGGLIGAMLSHKSPWTGAAMGVPVGALLGTGLGWLGGKNEQGLSAENLLDAHTQRMLNKQPLA